MPVTYAYQPELTYAPDASEFARVPRWPFGLSGGAFIDFSVEGTRTVADNAADVRESVSVLLQQHLRAYQIADPEDGEGAELMVPRWKHEATAELERTVARLEDDRPISAEFVFLAALGTTTVDSFLARARELLGNASTTRRDWRAFVDAEARLAAEQVAHESLAPMVDDGVERDEHQPLDTGLLSLADLRARVRRGALRGPRAFVDVSDV